MHCNPVHLGLVLLHSVLNSLIDIQFCFISKVISDSLT